MDRKKGASLPEDRTMEEVLSIYKETGVLVIDGRGKSSINTRIV